MRNFLFVTLIFISIHSLGQTRAELDSLTILLEKVSIDDQKFRLGLDSIIQKHGINSPEFIELTQKMNKQDSINISIVGGIIDKYGWLSAEETSTDANSALFFVIQHAPLESQLKYLPVMKKAVAEKKAKAADYALLVDRTNMFQGKFQIYGSQFYSDATGNIHIYPIFDEPNLNERRKSVGLPSMEEYCKKVSEYTNQTFNYVLPKTDRYKNKVVVKGSVTAKSTNEPLANVSISFGNNNLIGRSDNRGHFEIIIDREMVTTKIIFRAKGYQTTHQRLKAKGRDVVEVNALLNDKKYHAP
jgi:hypothetical protein